jgi:hypothetical protein
MIIGGKIILTEDYMLDEYDLNLFTRQVNFKKDDIFVVGYIDSDYRYHQKIIMYLTLEYNNSHLRYKITFDDMLYFCKYKKSDDRRLKLKQINKVKNMKLEKNLFELTKEQEETSKMLYNGKIVKFLIAPYHIHSDNPNNSISNKIEMDWAENIYMFPESDLSDIQQRQFMSLVVNNTQQEVLIITASQSIILDMFDGCARILTEFDTIVECPEKTFGANIHTINIEILNNKSHQKSKNSSYGNDFFVERINTIIGKIKDNDSFTQTEYDELMKAIKNIGEPLVSDKLSDMLRGKKIVGETNNRVEIEILEAELERLKKEMKENNKSKDYPY